MIRYPLGFAAGGVEVEQRRAIAADGELTFLAGNGGEGGGGFVLREESALKCIMWKPTVPDR